MLYEDGLQPIALAIAPRPGRMVVFDGEILHLGERGHPEDPTRPDLPGLQTRAPVPHAHGAVEEGRFRGEGEAVR